MRAPPPPQPVPNSSFRTAPATLNREAADMPAASGMPSAAATIDGPTEIVIRPTGLRHGRWEAPAWAFWTLGAAVIVLAAFYALARLGYVRKKAG